jgi:bacterioferritin
MENNEVQNSNVEIQEIRKHALQSLDSGAVTADYPLDLAQACRTLNHALASELMCVLRYRHHQNAAKGIDFPQVAAEFKEHAESEEGHALMIAERISQLGGKADFNPAHITENSSTEFGTAEELLSMIKEDLVAERIAIEVYRKNIQWFGTDDPTTRRMLESILADEENHANDMADLLSKVDRNKSGFTT